MELKISQLVIYPIKSMGGISLSASIVEPRGLQYDRRWMLVDERGRFISQRETSILALFRIRLKENALDVELLYDSNKGIHIPFLTIEEIARSSRMTVSVWDDSCEAIAYPDHINQWFSSRIEMPCTLVYMPDDSSRQIDPDYASAGEITSFSDGYPVLMIGQSSLDDLNSRMESPIPMNRFRPNIVFTGGQPFLEDSITNFEINECKMLGVKRCARCNIPTIDQDTTLTNNEFTAILASYRLINNKLLFGQNVIIKTFGEIHVGNLIAIPD